MVVEVTIDLCGRMEGKVVLGTGETVEHLEIVADRVRSMIARFNGWDGKPGTCPADGTGE